MLLPIYEPILQAKLDHTKRTFKNFIKKCIKKTQVRYFCKTRLEISLS